MSSLFSAHFNAIRSQLESVVVPACGNTMAMRRAVYCHKILTQLQMQLTVLPGLQQQAVEELGLILDQLLTALSKVEGTLGLNAQLLGHIRTAPDFVAATPHLQTAVRLLSEKPSKETSELLSRVAHILFTLEHEYNQQVQAHLIRPNTVVDEEQALSQEQKSRLQEYLRRQFPGESALEVKSSSLIVGGGSKATMIVDLEHAEKLPAQIVVRKDSAAGVVGSTVADEYFLIELMYNAGVPVPKPYCLEKDASMLEGAFIVVSKVEGHNIGDWNDVFEPTRAFSEDLARALALTHQVSVDSVAGKVSGWDQSPVDKLQADITEFSLAWRYTGISSIQVEQAYALLQNHIHFAEGRRSVVHGDAGCHNMLGHEGRLAALLDWECANVGNPALDLAYVHDTVIQMMPWQDFLKAYQQAGGILPSEKELDIYHLWTTLFKYHYTVIARAFIESGMTSLLIHNHGSEHLYQENGYKLAKAVKRFIDKYGVGSEW